MLCCLANILGIAWTIYAADRLSDECRMIAANPQRLSHEIWRKKAMSGEKLTKIFSSVAWHSVPQKAQPANINGCFFLPPLSILTTTDSLLVDLVSKPPLLVSL